MNDHLISQLINFGLSEKEAKIYKTLLELEVSTVFDVAKHSGINRSSAYVVLEGLKKKGLVGISDDAKVRKYIAASPETLLHSAQQSAKKHEEIKTGVESIIPELKALHKATKQKPTVKVFEGKNGLINALEETLDSREKKIRVVSGAIDELFQLIPEYYPDYIKRRIQKGIKMHGIHPNTEAVKEFMKIQAVRKFDEAVVIPKETYKASADLAIFDDKIGYMTPENGGFAVSIESTEMAKVMKNVFDLAYEEAKRLNKELTESKA